MFFYWQRPYFAFCQTICIIEINPLHLLKKLFTNITFWVLTAITAGALLGHFNPEQGVRMEFLGKGFISVVKVFINPIIFLTISLGIVA